MSSLIGHIAAGATAHAWQPAAARASRASLLACIALAVAPDVDYLLLWTVHVRLQPRLTHSIAFGVALALVVWLVLRRVARRPPPLLPLLAAALSHPVLDVLVGVHGSPLLWPATPTLFASPIGLLPSAGRLALGNPLLWRNLALELGVLLPVFAALLAVRRGVRWQPVVAVPVGALWLACLAASVSLSR